MLQYAPFVPLAQGVRTGVAILSYNRKVFFGVTADWDSVPDVDVLARGIERGMDDLLAASAAASAPATEAANAAANGVPRPARTGTRRAPRRRATMPTDA